MPIHEEIKILEKYYKQAKDAKISKRAHALTLLFKNYSFEEIRKIMMVSERTLDRWIKKYRQFGIGSIFSGYCNNQNAAKLTREQKREIGRYLRKNPLHNKFWSLPDLKKYISSTFDIEYLSKESYCAILRFCNYSYKLPSFFNIRRDEKEIKKRIKEIKNEIKPYLKKNEKSHEVFAADETRIEWNTLARRAWLQKGKKTIIKEKREKKFQNFIGFLDLKTGSQYLYRLSWQNQETIIPVLKELLKIFPNKKVHVVWDNAKFHKGKEIRSNLGEGKPLESLHLINFPPYAPDKNPQELVWRHIKDKISNQVFYRFEDLVKSFEGFAIGRKFHYKI